MKFKIGDNVKFLNDTGGGKVSRISSNGYIYVMTPDGFEIPVAANELIIDASFTNFNDLKENKEAIYTENKKETVPFYLGDKAKLQRNIPISLPAESAVIILIGLVPHDIYAVYKAQISCYLINDSDFYLYFMIGTQEQGNFYYLSSGEIEPNTKVLINEFDQAALTKISKFHLQVIVASKGHYYPIPPVNKEIDISQYDFLKNHIYKPNDYFDENALIISCVQSQKVSKKEDDSEKKFVSEKKTPEYINHQKPNDTIEVDLHIEALCNDYSQLSNTDILRIQINHFRNAMEDAISKKARRIVFIHGVGNGILKLELRNELKRNYPEFAFQDASFKEYGFGATLVYLNVIK